VGHDLDRGMRRFIGLRYVQSFEDRHGKIRHYFRRPGWPRVPLKGEIGSAEFEETYSAALRREPIEIGSTKVVKDSIRDLANKYYGSGSFKSMSKESQRQRRSYIERFCTRKDKTTGQPYGDKSATTLQAEHIRKILDEMSDKPESANGLRKALRAMFGHAVKTGLRKDNPTATVERVAVKSDGHHSWTDAEIVAFEAKHAIGTRARLAMALLLYSGQRRGDVLAMGPHSLVNGSIRVKQEKTGAELVIPLHPTLRDVLDKSPLADKTWLGMTGAAFNNWFRDACDAAGLRHCSAHGLRKAAARRLAEAGCSVHEIASVTGHTTLKEVARHTRAVDQGRLASAAKARIA
jgi:integrase